MARDTEPSRKHAGDQPSQGQQQTGPAQAGDADAGQPGRAGSDGFALLRKHHGSLRALLGECADITDGGQAEELLPRLADAWARHSQAHGQLYDAAVQAGLQEFPLLTETAIETDLVSFLLGRAGRDLEGPLELAGLRVAARLIGEIIEREEKPRSGLLAKAKAAGVEPAALGRRVGACMTRPSDGDGDTMPRLRHLTANQEDIMPRNANMPERDERGRFVSDDDYGGRGRGSSRYDDDRERDSRGRFMSDRDDDRRYGRDRDGDYGRHSRREDDDRRYARDRDDYARASRRYDDDRRYSRRDDDDRGYSRDRGQGGWFGDPEGHSEAARQGWDHRRDDDDRYSSRGRSRRYDDDDRRYSRRDDDERGYGRDRGQGGWFGDPEGHSEAARLGWDHRRDDDDDDRRYARGRR